MKLKKTVALALTAALLLPVLAGCGAKKPDASKGADAQAGGNPRKGEAVAKLEWKSYDEKIAAIQKEADPKKRAQLMHETETQLMDTGAIVPLYYYNDLYMKKADVKGVITTPSGHKFFKFATNGSKDTLKACIGPEPEKLDPALNSSVDGSNLAYTAFAGICTIDENGKAVPDLAEKIEKSADEMKYTITLRDGLKWSNGEKLDANDFIYSWNRAASKETSADYGYLFSYIKGYPDKLDVTASADGKVMTINLASPCAFFQDLLAFTTFLPVYKKDAEKGKGAKDDKGKPNPGVWATEAGFVSNGPFVLKSWKHSASMVYEKNPNYYRANDVKLNKIEFMLTSDDNAQYNAFKTGDLDFIETVPNGEIQKLKTTPEWNVINQLGTYYVAFNINNKDLFGGLNLDQAKKLRKAISLLVDRKAIVETVGQTGQEIANSFIPSEMKNGAGEKFHKDGFKYPVDNGYVPIKRDVAGAKKLLTEAGFKFNGDKLDASNPIHFEYLTNEGTGHVKVAQLLQADLKEVGITMEIKQMAWSVFLAERKKGNFGIARNGWIADFDDPINMLEMWTSDSGNNDCQLGK